MKTKHTKGEWRVFNEGDSIKIKDQSFICFLQSKYGDELFGVYAESTTELLTKDVAEANAKLIADAGTTANKCGLLPSELLEQRNDLLESCMEAKAMYEAQCINESSIIGGEQYSKLLNAIKKATE